MEGLTYRSRRGGARPLQWLKPIAEVCRKLGTSEQTYYRWRKEYGGLRVHHLKRLKTLELEHGRLRTVVADQALALVILRETAGKTD